MDTHTSITLKKDRPWAVFLIFLGLGLTSFGGPVAHLGYFRQAFVERRKWFTEQAYAELVALCQFLPGPASSQVGMGIGYHRAGYGGAFAAWLGFTLPSALVLILLALGLQSLDQTWVQGSITGLKVVAVAVVVQALWGMANVLCPDKVRISVMAFATMITCLMPGVWTQVLVILVAGAFGSYFLSHLSVVPDSHDQGIFSDKPRWHAKIFLSLFLVLLLILPLLSSAGPGLQLFDAFYRSGALVFGGGHVVLPLLQTELVPSGHVSAEAFLAGYGATQAVPGPLFTFAAFLGASNLIGPSGWTGGLFALLAIFLPSCLLVFGILPFWQSLRTQKWLRSALLGINAAVVGLLLAALYHPVWTNGVLSPQHFSLALFALVCLMFWKLPVWLVVILGAFIGALGF